MIALNYSTLRNNMKSWFDKMTDDQETIIVTRKKENIVMMPQSSYDSLMETLYLLGNEANRKHLEKSIKQYKKGQIKEHALDEDSMD